jgi:DNA-directed RNA polymerase specialized sigma24 family protein
MGAIGEGTPEMETPAQDKEPCATRAEKLAAFTALTPKDLGGLLNYARYIARTFPGRVNDADADDLYQQAILRALDSRCWYPRRVDFRGFVAGTIRSTGSQWRRNCKYTELPDDLVSPSLEDNLDALFLMGDIKKALKDRAYAVEILELKRLGLTAKEIQKKLGIPKNVYDAGVKWIDRTLKGKGFQR